MRMLAGCKRLRVYWLVLLCIGLGACQGGVSGEDWVGAGLTGIDHLPDHMSVPRFSLDGQSGAQAGKGGSTVCCAALPSKWRPDLTAVVRWRVTNWRDCHGESFEQTVTVDRYEVLGHIWVHFLADGSVRVVSSDEGPRSPTYPGPRELIPQKKPWSTYDWASRCPKKIQANVKETLQ